MKTFDKKEFMEVFEKMGINVENKKLYYNTRRLLYLFHSLI